MSEASLVTRIEIDGAKEAIRTLRDYFMAYKEGEVDVKALNMGLREWSGQISGANRALRLMRSEWRLQNVAWVELARVMRSVGSIGRQLTSMWQAYTVGMIRIESAQRDVTKATKSVADAQEWYNRCLEVFGENSVYTKDAWNDLQGATDAEKDSLNRAREAQDDMNAGMITFGLSAVGIGSNIITAISHINDFKNALSDAKTMVSGLGGALAGLSGAAGLAVSGAIIAPFAGIAIEAIRTGEEMYAQQMALPESERFGAFRAPSEALRRSVTRQFGGFLPETGWFYGHKGEEVVAAPIARMSSRGGGGVTVRHVTINQYIGNVSSDVDVTRMGEGAYRKFMRKMEAVR